VAWECRKWKQPPAGTPVPLALRKRLERDVKFLFSTIARFLRDVNSIARCELYCEINRPPSLGAPSWRAKPDGSLYFGALG